MAYVLRNAVKETSTTIGTGNLTLDGASSAGFDTFYHATLSPVGSTFPYVITNAEETFREWGIGTLLTETTFSRAPHASSNGGASLDLEAGTHLVFLSPLAEDFDTFTTTVTVEGLIDDALVPYYDATETNSAISAALVPYATTVSVTSAINTALIPYSTSAQIATLLGDYLTITSAAATYSTPASVTTQINAALVPYVTLTGAQNVSDKTITNSSIGSSNPSTGAFTTVSGTTGTFSGAVSAKHTTDAAPLSVTELVTNGTFTGSLTGWTGTNWSASSNKALHTTGSTAALTQNISVILTLPYVVVVTVSGRTAGSVTPAIGAATGTAISTNTTSTQILYALANGSVALNLTPSTDFDGSLDDVSVKVIDAWTAPFSLLSSGGTPAFEARANTTNLTIGYNVGKYTYTGVNNTVFGINALRSAANASNNTGFGFNVFSLVTTGGSNTAFGALSQQALTTGTLNSSLQQFGVMGGGGGQPREKAMGHSDFKVAHGVEILRAQAEAGQTHKGAMA